MRREGEKTVGKAMSEDDRIGKSLADIWLGRSDPVTVWTAIAAKARALLSPPAREMVALSGDDVIGVLATARERCTPDRDWWHVVVECAAEAQRNKIASKADPSVDRAACLREGMRRAFEEVRQRAENWVGTSLSGDAISSEMEDWAQRRRDACAAPKEPTAEPQPTPAKAESATPALHHAESSLRDNAGCRGIPSDANALTGDDCRVLAEELDRLRAECATWKSCTLSVTGRGIQQFADLLAEIDAARAELAEIRALSIQSTMPAHRELMPARLETLLFGEACAAKADHVQRVGLPAVGEPVETLDEMGGGFSRTVVERHIAPAYHGAISGFEVPGRVGLFCPEDEGRTWRRIPAQPKAELPTIGEFVYWIGGDSIRKVRSHWQDCVDIATKMPVAGFNCEGQVAFKLADEGKTWRRIPQPQGTKGEGK